MYYLLIIFLAMCLMFRGAFGFCDDAKALIKKGWNGRKSVRLKKRCREFNRIENSLVSLKAWGEELDEIYARKS